ncbi:MAG: protein kinase [Deltaproteobacteria bacterium]|nr:protein kinase [Deltaproteobacteria bacterium]
MAEVFKAVKKGPDGFAKTVALKKIIPYYTDHPQFIKMLSTEAKIHSQLDHPNIVQLYDFFQYNTQYMIAMEYVDGRNAQELIRACKQSGIALPWQACVFMLAEVLKALHYAHQKTDQNGPLSIVHRDISPHNILISFEGRIKLSDFGIANAKIKEDKTQSGILKGKYRYLAPEQVTAEEVTHQTDLFSCGVTLYELLTFTHPFPQEQEFELLKNIVQGTYLPAQEINPDIPLALQDVLIMAMQPEPEDRFPDAKAFLDELLALQDSQWVSYGEEHLARIIEKAFPAKQRIETALEPTKILQHTDLSIHTDQSFIQKNVQPPKKMFKSGSVFLAIITLIPLLWYFYTRQPKKQPIPNTSSFSLQPQPSLQSQKTSSEPQKQNDPPKQQTKALAPSQVVSPEAPRELQKKPTTPTVKLGIVTFSGPYGSEVFINGKKIGTLPMKQYFLSPGTYLILLSNGQRKTVKSITISSGQSQHVEM